MEYETRFSNTLRNVFNNHIIDYYIESLSEELTLDSNDVFNRSLIINIKSDEFEVPIIARDKVEDIIMDNIKSLSNPEKIILPLYANSSPITKSTFDRIITLMFNVDYSHRLQKFITSRGDSYYGGKGIIFDSDYNPLLLCTLAARKVPDNIIYYRPICRVSPRVFTGPDNLIKRGIIKKLIPFFSGLGVNFFDSSSSFISGFESDKVKIIVDNFDNFFIKPVKPTPSTCSDDILNQCLIDNIDDIMMLI